MSWLLAAQKLGEMHSSRVCVRCGAVVPADNGWCDRCGLQRGLSGDVSDAQGQTAPVATDGLRYRARGQLCDACGARLSERADWCSECGQSRIPLLAAAATPAAANWRSGQTPRSSGLSHSAMAALGAMFLFVVMAVGALAASSARTGSGVVAGGSGTNPLVAAGTGSVNGAAGTFAGSTSAGSESAGSQFSATPLGSSNTSGAMRPATAPPGGSPGASMGVPPTASTSGGQAAATPAPTSATALGVDIASLPASMSANATVTLVVTTAPGASCKAQVKDHGGKLSLAAGLKKKQTANAIGTVTWTWTVDKATTSGSATVTVTCNLGPRSGSKTKDVLVI